jgi:hypothetical protein
VIHLWLFCYFGFNSTFKVFFFKEFLGLFFLVVLGYMIGQG